MIRLTPADYDFLQVDVCTVGSNAFTVISAIHQTDALAVVTVVSTAEQVVDIGQGALPLFGCAPAEFIQRQCVDELSGRAERDDYERE